MEYDLVSTTIPDLYQRLNQDLNFPCLSKRESFELWSEYFEWLRTGRKCTTIRYRIGAIDVPCSVQLPLIVVDNDNLNESPPEYLGHVTILKITIKSFGSLDHNDAIRDGFQTEEELKQALQKIYSSRYKPIDDRDYVSVYQLKFSFETDE